LKRLLFLLFFSQLAFSQKDGIVFLESPSYTAAVKKAKEEKKLIFLDAYTTWCGPCVSLERRVFPNKDLGEYINKHFISLRVDMEEGEGPALANVFMINAYPTMFFIDPSNGRIIRRILGYKEADFLLSCAKKVIEKKSIN
jgi:thioredoxin 1